MKLRLRNLETRETVRIDIVSSSSVHQLQQVLSASLFPPPPSPSSLRFSLNAKDELHAPSPSSSLLFLGVTAGDLIYFSLNPNVFSAPIPAEGSQTAIPAEASISLQEPTAVDVEGSSIQDKTVVSQKIDNESQSLDQLISQGSDAKKFDETLDSEGTVMAAGESQSMDVDGFPPVRDSPEPYFLDVALREELGQEHRSNDKLLIISLHAVLLQSGFVPFDRPTGRVDCRRLSDKWTSISQTSSLSYTLLDLLDSNTGGDMNDRCIVMRFQSLGNFVSVYGSLAGDGSGLRNVRLDDRFATAIKRYVLEQDGGISVDKASGSVFDFWKIVKDELALPLMVNLCEKAGLPVPGCFARLPTELKLKILESLPGVDLARMEIVSKDMKYIVSDSGLWKKKFSEEFGEQVILRTEEHVKWKLMFASKWVSKRNRRIAVTRLGDYPRPVAPHYSFVFGDPDRLEFPGGGIIGGEYDRLPGLAVPRLGPQALFPPPPVRRRSIFRTNCNIGGHDI